MSARLEQYDGLVLRREQLSPHLVRVVLDVPGFVSTGLPDEWVGLVVPGQFQSRYYTVRSWDGAEMVLDVVVHESGLVTDWVVGDCLGDAVTITEPKGSFSPPPSAAWVVLVGDLTALPAIARITESVPAQVWIDVPELPSDYLSVAAQPSGRGLAETVAGIDWPDGPGYFWMAGESSQMRAVRKHVMRDLSMAPSSYSLMGYWRAGATRQPRAVDVG